MSTSATANHAGSIFAVAGIGHGDVGDYRDRCGDDRQEVNMAQGGSALLQRSRNHQDAECHPIAKREDVHPKHIESVRSLLGDSGEYPGALEQDVSAPMR